jgi:hypothetical protein
VDVADELVGTQTRFVSSGSADKLCQQVLQTKFVCSFCRQSLSAQETLTDNSADKLCLQKIRPTLAKMQTNIADKSCRQTLSAENPPKTGPKCRQTLQTNFVSSFCRQSLSAQETLTDKLCRQTLSAENPPNPGQNADKSCRQTLSAKTPPKTGPKCRQILQTNLVKTENCRQLQKSVDKVCAPSLDKVCLS